MKEFKVTSDSPTMTRAEARELLVDLATMIEDRGYAVMSNINGVISTDYGVGATLRCRAADTDVIHSIHMWHYDDEAMAEADVTAAHEGMYELLWG